MTEAAPSRQRFAPRGRVDKRRAILDAAFAVFARQGYEQSGVREVAAEAGVAKPTVYNHFADKEDLFRNAVRTAADAVQADCLAVLDALREPGGDLAAALEDAAYRLLVVCCDERSTALRRLTHAQVVHFPDLVEDVHARTSLRVAEALADRLARLCLSERLRPCDPAQAAEQFLALLTAPMEARSHLGNRTVPPTETHALATAAVDTFLRAYLPPPPGPA
ncbi:TetR/AcrR family transcriptional regulator [Yinghuangia sp. ASG 101]|uniref:TetR/AcrR family transcriptional regulator n=1 Tax=Yinghuangia sp. ASG 101 TaxID=2896848 RepID=UPI001E42B492|nr:TetR/AcrR family transcriptional regulator [Yinghuangia sp. ASG 101]UGQ14869.1 TetR/AcrR family transcriptional regulator [Yinghuangia sp. ASG 101]